MTWASQVLEYKDRLEQIVAPGVQLHLQPFDYGFAIAAGVERGKDRQGLRILSSHGLPSKNWLRRTLENWGWVRRKSQHVPPERAAARIAQWLRSSGFGQSPAITGYFEWEFIAGDESVLNVPTN